MTTLAPAAAPKSAEAQTQAYLATIPADVNARSISYTDGGHWLILWGLLISAILTWIIVRTNVLVRVRNWASAARPRPVLASAAVAAVFGLVSWVLDLPWETYTGWWREKSYGLTKQPFGDWFGQSLLSLAIGTIVISLVIVGIYALIRKFPQRWWLLSGGASAVFILVMLLIAPVYIMPLFNDYKPFPNGKVRDAIVKLAVDNGVPADKVFVYDGSRQRDVVTANVAGIFGSARIAVSDIALERASLSEVRAVVGHEIGHYALGHSFRSAFFFAGLMMLGFYGVHRLFPTITRYFGGHNITGITDPAGLPILSFIVGLVLTLATPLTNTLIRIGETEADNYSLKVARDPDGLASALIKTVEYRKASPGKLEEIIFHDHPSVENRVRNAMKWKVKNQATLQ
jgi:STE24 endopeptidase